MDDLPSSPASLSPPHSNRATPTSLDAAADMAAQYMQQAADLHQRHVPSSSMSVPLHCRHT